LTFANDDDNINVNILHLCFSYWQKKLSLVTILIYSLEAWKGCKKLDLEKFQFWFCLTIFLFCCIWKPWKNCKVFSVKEYNSLRFSWFRSIGLKHVCWIRFWNFWLNNKEIFYYFFR
jgi:hypothetical protein